MAWRSGAARQRHRPQKGFQPQPVGLTNICQYTRTRARSGSRSPRARATSWLTSSWTWPMRYARPRTSRAGVNPAWAGSSSAPRSRRGRACGSGLRPSSSASASRSSTPACASSSARRRSSAPACSGWRRSCSRSRALASRWSRISSAHSSMPASRCWRALVGDSSTMSRADCSWSASVAWRSRSAPMSGLSRSPSASTGVNCRACSRIRSASDSSTSAISCTR